MHNPIQSTVLRPAVTDTRHVTQTCTLAHPGHKYFPLSNYKKCNRPIQNIQYIKKAITWELLFNKSEFKKNSLYVKIAKV